MQIYSDPSDQSGPHTKIYEIITKFNFKLKNPIQKMICA